MTVHPEHREADVVLRDGTPVHVRPARADDAPAVEQLLKGLSDRSRWLRFFSGRPNLAKAVQWATEVDDHRYGLLATGSDGRVIGHIGFERDPDRPERAEVAMEIADAMQDKGLGTILLGRLAEAARELDVQVLTAEVLPENHQMIKEFRDCGFPVRTNPVPGALLIEFRTSRIRVQAASPGHRLRGSCFSNESGANSRWNPVGPIPGARLKTTRPVPIPNQGSSIRKT
jgi:RimJ/RimL family protein N-acetyltransferase